MKRIFIHDFKVSHSKLVFDSIAFALPERDYLNRRVIFYRPKAYNPSTCINHDIIRVNGVAFETLLEEEENQIRGCVHVVDASGIGLNYITVLTPQEAYRITKNAEVSLSDLLLLIKD